MLQLSSSETGRSRPSASEICALQEAVTRCLGDMCSKERRDPVPRRYVLYTMRRPGSTITNGWLLDVRRYGCNIGTPQGCRWPRPQNGTTVRQPHTP